MAGALDTTIERAEAAIVVLARARCPQATVFSFGAVDIDPRHLAIWITTPTDRERDRLARDMALAHAMRDALREAGYPADAVDAVGFEFESEETVRRDFDGNWWHAVK